VLLITGQVDSRHYGANRGCFHEAERQLEMLGAVARTAESVRRPQDVAAAVMRVLAAVQSGRPQPGVVEIPIDFQEETFDAILPEPIPSVRAQPAARLLSAAGEALASARRPLLWAGGGVVSAGAAPALVAVAERLSAPVVTTVQGRGAIPEDHPLALGANAQSAPVAAILAEADVVLAVGTRFEEDETAGWTLRLPDMLIHLDASPDVIGRSYPSPLPIVGDAQLGLSGVLECLGRRSTEPGWPERGLAARRSAEAKARALIGTDHESIMDSIRQLLPRSGIIVRDATIPAYTWGDRLLPVYQPRTSIWPTSGAIGPGLPLAIGAAVGSRRRVVLIQGDGGFMLHLGELATAVEHQVPVTVCLFNDEGYGVIRALQDRRCSGRRIGVDLRTPDFCALAAAFGMDAARVASAGDFRTALQHALGRDAPYLIEVNLSALEPITLAAAWAQ
jgi:acetolactate synthase-1/2/3 large subunit